MRPAPDDAVIALAKLGDQGAWDVLYRTHAGRLRVWLRARPSGDAAVGYHDVAAEAWLVAASRIGDFDGDSEQFAGWLFGIARNISRNTHRRSQRQATIPVASVPHSETAYMPGADPASHVGDTDLVRLLLAQLPRRQAGVVACRDVVGLDVAATGRALGISATAVRVSHSRGLRRLVALLQGDPAGTETLTARNAIRPHHRDRPRLVRQHPSISECWPA